MRVCVFCGSRFGQGERFRAAALAVGEGLARRGWTLVYGGGDVGLMGVCADAAIAGGAEVVGYIPERLLDREVGHRGITRLEITRDMFHRKSLMIAESDAFLILPGGLGTLDEVLEVMTLRQLGYHAKPIVLIDGDGYWAPFLAMLDRMIDNAFAGEDVRDMLELAANGDAALARLDPARPPDA